MSPAHRSSDADHESCEGKFQPMNSSLQSLCESEKDAVAQPLMSFHLFLIGQSGLSQALPQPDRGKRRPRGLDSPERIRITIVSALWGCCARLRRGM